MSGENASASSNRRALFCLPKKSRFLELRLMKSLSGTPRTSMIQDNCSCSFSPGKMGKPVYNSARIHPKLHMSMAMW